MYPFSGGDTFLVQQMTAAVPGTSVFDGTDYGRAVLALFGGGAANGRLWFRAKRYGADSNSFLIVLTNPGGTFPTTTVTQTGPVIEVKMRTVAGVIQATAKEIADAVNAVTTYSFPVVADYDRTTNGLGVASAVTATALAGGVNPRAGDEDLLFKWDIPFDVNCGLYHFEQDYPVVIRQMGANFPTVAAPTDFNVWVVNLTPGLGVYADEKVPLFYRELDTGTNSYVGFSDNRSPILPGQALLVECALPGVVTFTVRRDSRFPYS